MENNKEELLKLIKDNPTLPIIFFTSNDDIADDYGTTFRKNYKCTIQDIYEREDRVHVDFEDLVEELTEFYASEPGYCDMPDEEFERAIENIAKSEPSYTAITIHVWS